MRIITISREFGSGGRELGKRISDIMGFDYYDREIITAIAAKRGMDKNYIESVLNNHGWRSIPISYRRSFAVLTPNVNQVNLLVEQKRVIEAIAQSGKDCVIVGRNADVLLEEREPFRIFVCAEMEDKVRRCIERSRDDEKLTYKDAMRSIKLIDKNRAQARALLSGDTWGRRDAYELTINTTNWNIKELANAVADFASRWFGRDK